jgi:hypothetical protein
MPKMSNNARLPFVTLVALLLVSAILSACNSAQPTAPVATPTPAVVDACAGVSDSAIIKEIGDKVRADAQFKGQLDHIAVNSKDRVVSLLGWAKGEAGVAAIAQYATATKCVTKVNNLLHTRLTVGCGNDEEDCPGIGCVPRGQCSSGLGEGSMVNGAMPSSSSAMPATEEKPAASPSPSPSPSPTPKPRRQ